MHVHCMHILGRQTCDKQDEAGYYAGLGMVFTSPVLMSTVDALLRASDQLAESPADERATSLYTHFPQTPCAAHHFWRTAVTSPALGLGSKVLLRPDDTASSTSVPLRRWQTKLRHGTLHTMHVSIETADKQAHMGHHVDNLDACHIW